MSPFDGKGLRRDNFSLKTNYIIDKFLVERAITIIFAAPKQGKSRFANGLAKLLFTETEFHPQYFDFDNPLSALKDRGIDDLVEEGGDRFDYIHPEKVAITSKEALDRLVENAEGDNYAGYVFFFDSATDFCNENDDSSVKVFMNKLKVLRNAGATIVVLHHTNKQNQAYKGSTVFKSACDNAYSLTNEYQDSEGVVYTLDMDAGRFKIENQAFRLSNSGYELKLMDYNEVKIPYHERLEIRKVTKTLEQNGKMKQGDLLSKALDSDSTNKSATALLDKYTDKYWTWAKEGKFKIYTLI